MPAYHTICLGLLPLFEPEYLAWLAVLTSAGGLAIAGDLRGRTLAHLPDYGPILKFRRQALPISWLLACCAAVGWVLQSPSLYSHAAVLVLLIGWGLVAADVTWLITGWACCGAVAVALSSGVGLLAGLWIAAAALGAFAGLSKRGASMLPPAGRRFLGVSRPADSDARLRELDRELRHVRLRLGLLTESLPIGVFEADITGRCRFLTAAASDILGVGFLDGFIGSWFDHVIPADRMEVAANWRVSWQQNEPFSTECRVTSPDRGQRWIHVRCRPLTTDFGGVYLGTVEDITEQRRTARELKRFAESLDRARAHELEKNQKLESLVAALKQSQIEVENGSRAKSEFLANMSHEIRTPMSAILGFTDILLEEAGEALPADAPLRTIRSNGEYLLDLLNDVLDFSKIEAGHQDLEQVRCSPKQIAADVLNLMEVKVRDRDVRLICTVDDPFPETVVSDPTRLKQVLVNLVGNSIKFTRQGTISVRLSLESETSGLGSESQNLTIRVTDTGIGMSPDQISRLYRPFCQGDTSTTRMFGGTGLGLTICKSFIEKLGGNIRVSSQPGQGSTFAVTLPAVGAEFQERNEESKSHSPIAKQPSADSEIRALPPGSRILVAEDGADNQRLLTLILKKAGAEIVVVENGEEAVKEALIAANSDAPFDVIIMDMQMPVLDGYGATKQLRAAGYRGAISALTAHAMASDREKCLAAGCDDYLRKPVRRQELLSALQRLIHANRQCCDLRTAGVTTDAVPELNPAATPKPMH